MSTAQKSLAKRRDFTYESDPSILLINLFDGIPGNFLISFSDFGTVQETARVQGGLLTFGRTSDNRAELHAIRLHETVEAPILMTASSSKINSQQPFDIISDSEFKSRGIKSSSVHEKSDKAVIFESDEAMRLFLEFYNDILEENLEHPNPSAVIKSTSGITTNGKNIVCLYTDSGNIYAGVEI